MKTLIIVALVLAVPTSTIEYNREAHLVQEFWAHGCAFDSCPQVIKDKALEETNGVYPPSHYEKGTKDYWRSYCTFNAELCK